MTRLLLLVLLAGVAVAGPKKKPVAQPAPKPAWVAVAKVIDRSQTPGVEPAAIASIDARLASFKPVTRLSPDAPIAETTKLIAAKKGVGLELAFTFSRANDLSDVTLVVSTWPDHRLLAEYRAGGGGTAGPVDLVDPLVERLLEDLAKDQGWSHAK